MFVQEESEVAFSIQQIEDSLEVIKESIADEEALDRLSKNKDFKRLFLKGFLEEHLLRANRIKARLPVSEAAKREDYTFQMDAIGYFGEYMEMIRVNSRNAQLQLPAHEQRLEDLRNPDSDYYAEAEVV